jgi:hypothetical protein
MKSKKIQSELIRKIKKGEMSEIGLIGRLPGSMSLERA